MSNVSDSLVLNGSHSNLPLPEDDDILPPLRRLTESNRRHAIVNSILMSVLLFLQLCFYVALSVLIWRLVIYVTPIIIQIQSLLSNLPQMQQVFSDATTALPYMIQIGQQYQACVPLLSHIC